MTKKEALQILIEASVNDIRGAGLGYRNTTQEWREKVSNAIRELYKDAYDIVPDWSTDFNLGLTTRDK